MKSSCFLVPLHEPKFESAFELVKSYNNFFDDDHIYLIFSSEEDEIKFKKQYQVLKYRSLVCLEPKTSGIVTVKKYDGLKKIFSKSSRPTEGGNFFGDIERIIGFNPKIIENYTRAFTHRSINKVDLKGNPISYERLEFLGDKILGMVMAEELYKSFPGENEGTLSKKQSFLVSGNLCYKVANDISIGRFIILSKPQEKDGGRKNKKILSCRATYTFFF
jgi:hypothetical protein